MTIIQTLNWVAVGMTIGWLTPAALRGLIRLIQKD